MEYKNIIAIIRSSLSLSIKELATATYTTQEIVYTWIDEEAIPVELNRQRLEKIYEIAKYWNKLSNQPLGCLIHHSTSESKSILEYFKVKEINVEKIKPRLDSLAAISNPQKQSFFKKIAKKRNLARPVISNKSYLDAASGKRFDIE